jgi:hypothetical protein
MLCEGGNLEGWQELIWPDDPCCWEQKTINEWCLGLSHGAFAMVIFQRWLVSPQGRQGSASPAEVIPEPSATIIGGVSLVEKLKGNDIFFSQLAGTAMSQTALSNPCLSIVDVPPVGGIIYYIVRKSSNLRDTLLWGRFTSSQWLLALPCLIMAHLFTIGCWK